MNPIQTPPRPELVVRRGRPDVRRAKAVLGRIRAMRETSPLRGKSVEEIVRMTKRTREQIWKEKLRARTGPYVKLTG